MILGPEPTTFHKREMTSGHPLSARSSSGLDSHMLDHARWMASPARAVALQQSYDGRIEFDSGDWPPTIRDRVKQDGR